MIDRSSPEANVSAAFVLSKREVRDQDFARLCRASALSLSVMFSRPRLLQALGAVVALAGFVVFALLVATPWYTLVVKAPIQFGLLAALVFLGELNPVSLMRRGRKDETAPSTTFSFAILLSMGAGPAIATLVLAGLLADVRQRRSRARMAL